MPCKRRVLDGHLTFRKNASAGIVNWKPGGLPDAMGCLARCNGVGFTDVTPALVKETERGRLTYNAVWEPHLNSDGARVVAQEMAKSERSRGASIPASCSPPTAVQ